MNIYDRQGKKIIYLIVGKSGSGKSTVVKKIIKNSKFRDLPDKFNPFKEVESATTRPPRYKGETGHRFIDNETYEKENDRLLSYTCIAGNHYYTTPEDLDGKLFYVVDPRGVEFFKDSKFGDDYHPIVVWVKCNEFVRICRLIKRDGFIKAIKRWIDDLDTFKNWKRINPNIIADNTIADLCIEVDIFSKNYWSISKLLDIIPKDAQCDVVNTILDTMEKDNKK